MTTINVELEDLPDRALYYLVIGRRKTNVWPEIYEEFKHRYGLAMPLINHDGCVQDIIIQDCSKSGW